MEQLCIFDLRVIYIMQQQTPSYKIICEFINKYIIPFQYDIFTMITRTIIYEFSINVDDQYLDGTKLEANANKYKFVWKPTTYHKKLDIKVKQYLRDLQYDNLSNKKEIIKAFELNEIIKDYILKNNITVNRIPSGRGSRLTKEQKKYKVGYQYILKFGFMSSI